MTPFWKISRAASIACLVLKLGAVCLAQETGGKPADKPGDATTVSAKKGELATFPFQILLLDTHIRFEQNGDSRKEVHTIIKLNNAVGAQEFSRLGFDYNRAFQQVEIPMVRVTHTNGGTSEVLPSAVTDAPNPVVEKYPAYHDVRVKSVRILGLQEGDTVEYRVITMTTKHPLAPDFWVEHTFDRSGQVLEENYELDLPEERTVQIRINPNTPAQSKEPTGDGKSKWTNYRWNKSATKPPEIESASAQPDVSVTTFASWSGLAKRLSLENPARVTTPGALDGKARELSGSNISESARLAAYYEFVRREIEFVDLPLAAMGFQYRPADEVLSSRCGTTADKFVLLRALAANSVGELRPVFIGDQDGLMERLPIPSDLTKLLTTIVIFPPGKPDGHGHTLVCTECEKEFWLDIGVDVAPFGMVRATLRGKLGLRARTGSAANSEHLWHRIPDLLPFTSFQRVGVNATLEPNGKLIAKVKYTLRGDNELLLRLAFHQTPKEKWKEVAGILALSDGFRGVITSAAASDPMETKTPFTVEYELAQDKFVDWTKKPIRIPALLPQIGLPEVSGKDSAGNIELGTPLDVETQVSLRLPEGTTVQAPAGTKLERDYATYSSKYGFTGGSATALRHIHFLQREVAGNRAIDYSAFVQSVQNDQSQYFVLERGAGVKSAALQ